MNVSIVGITGYIGKNLGKYLVDQGIHVLGIYRKDLYHFQRLQEKIIWSDVVINLSGESIIGIWTEKKKKKIYESRVLVTRKIIEAIGQTDKDLVYINASATGIYDNISIHDEKSRRYAKNFLAKVVMDWEQEVTKIKQRKVRSIIVRMGIVIGKDGGYLGKQNFMLKRGICVLVGKKDEYLPVICLDELLRVFTFIINNNHIHGIVNAVAPVMVKVDEFYSILREIMKVILFVKIPDSIVRILLGEASMIFLKGQCVIPDKLIKSGYNFRHESLKSMLNSVLLPH